MSVSAPVYISGTNTFVPAATGQAIAYVRNPAKFKINRYCQIVRAPKPVVLYAFLDPDEPVRVVTDQEYDWPDGQPRPRPQANVGNFYWNEVRVFRRNYGYTVGEQALEAAEGFNPRAFFNAIMLSKAMTNLTQRVTTLLETTANWGSNTGSAGTLNGEGVNWVGASNDESSASFLAIKRTLLAAVRNINLATNGMVDPSDLKLVISPDLALTIAETSEIHTYIEKSVWALAQLRGDAPNQNMYYNLPNSLYGLELVVEDAPRTTTRQVSAMTPATLAPVGGTGQKQYIKTGSIATIVSRVGGLDGQYGSPSFSTLQRYYYKYEMAIEARVKAWDKYTEAACVDQFKEVLAAPQSGYCITGCM